MSDSTKASTPTTPRNRKLATRRALRKGCRPPCVNPCQSTDVRSCHGRADRVVLPRYLVAGEVSVSQWLPAGVRCNPLVAMLHSAVVSSLA